MNLANKLLAIVGCSGSGKTTLEHALVDDYKVANRLTSVTTRPMRDGEVDGVHYYYTNEEEFAGLDLLESTVYAGNRYGLTADEVRNKTQDKPAVVVVETNGLKQLRQICPDLWSVWIDVPEDELRRRMELRGDSIDQIQKRTALFASERETISLHTFRVENVTLTQAAKDIQAILRAMQVRT